MPRRTQLSVISALIAALVVAPALPAAAVPPLHIPPAGAGTSLIADSDSPCGSFTMVTLDNQRTRVFTNKVGDVTAISTTGSLRVKLISDVTGRSIDLNVSGPLFIRGVADPILTGSMLLYAKGILAFVHGRAVITGGLADRAVITGARRDLCPILNP
ncbi:hypothetical protein [Cryobacterium tagatosivorans]|uniref:Uncharacterized protein n=1 Tax=Cryobacterium tagatosivorans TaxID=1259199 RepID=A0A4R8UES1_9MICO|nr:hypothetical protein [Cryobacterium tagatosivorans]TFB50309.1 hypothetical protein E3O23_09975 [Cryobacterium tagatosivorans]